MTMEKQTTRKLYIDSLKGLACLFVFIGHYYYGFFSNVQADVEIYPIIRWFHKLFFLCFNGTFCVSFFSFISGYLSKKCYGMMEVILNSLKRYFRLAFPIMFLCIIIFVMNKLGLFEESRILAQELDNPWLDCVGRGNMSFLSLFYNSVFGILFLGRANYSTQLWMISSMFIGQILFYCFSASESVGNKWHRLIIRILVVIGCLFFQYPCLAAFLGGIYGVYGDCVNGRAKKIYGALLVVLFAFGHFKGYLLFSGISIYGKDLQLNLFIQVFMAAGIFVSISNIAELRELLERKWLIRLGKISFEIYLLHILFMASVACPLFRTLGFQKNYKSTYLIVEVITIFLVFLGSIIWNITVTPSCAYICKKINNYIDDWMDKYRDKY